MSRVAVNEAFARKAKNEGTHGQQTQDF